jgi:acetyl esterase
MIDSRLDPQIRKILEEAEASGGPSIETLPHDEARRLSKQNGASLAGDPAPVAQVEDRAIMGPDCAIPLRIYTPDAAKPAPGLVYFHGGGWVLCDLDTHDVICRSLARRAGAVVVSVDYRLAPEHKFPAAVIDCFAATVWVYQNAAALGIDPHRLSIAGDSAGGNLAAVVALQARDEAAPRLALQALIYPATDLSSFETASHHEFAEGYDLSRSKMEWFRNHYLASPRDRRSLHASPLLAPDLSGLPPALILTAECDPLRDEGEAYAARLKAAGVPVRSTRYRGMIHPFFAMQGAVRQAREALAEVAAAVAAARAL